MMEAPVFPGKNFLRYFVVSLKIFINFIGENFFTAKEESI